MKWELDDNTRSGFHYLVVGVLAVGVPAALLSLFDAWHDRAVADGTLPLGIFHNGYLLFDGDRTAVADTTRAERLAYACAISTGITAVCIALLLVVRSGAAWRLGRWVLGATLGWCSISALFLPRTTATVAPGKLEVHERSTLAGDITWPFSRKTTLIEWTKRDVLLGLSLPASGITDVLRMSYHGIHQGDTLLFATTGTRSDLFGPNARSTPSDDAAGYMHRLLYQR